MCDNIYFCLIKYEMAGEIGVMWLSKMVLEFIVFSLLGWIYETIYTIFKTKKWEKRGFLFGPICPIYGVGAVAAIWVARSFQEFHVDYNWWQIFLIAFVGSAILEYGTSWALERLFHAYWWDYSDMPLNINGRICLPASLLFGVIGNLIVFFVVPLLDRYESLIPGILAELLSLVVIAIVAADLTLTAVILTDFANVISNMEQNINQRMEVAVENMNGPHFSAIQRVKGFRFRSSEKFKLQQTEKVLELIRKSKIERKERRKAKKKRK